MPYSRVTRTAFGADAIDYLMGRNGKGHNGNEVRNLYIGSVNMLPNNVVPFAKQMQIIWDMADSRHTTQIDRYTLSFGLSELDPDNPEDHIKAGAIAEQFARKIAPDHQAIIGVQNDGKGGKLHAHVFINDGRIQDGKGMDPLSYAHFHFQKIVDEICEQYFDLEKAEAQPEKVNPSVRGARIKNEQIRAANAREIQRAAAEGREVDPKKIKAERYIWQDDLRQRVKDAAAKATDEADFAHQLRLSGVELVPPKDKDEEPLKDENGNIVYLHPATKKQPPHYTYELVDTTGFPDKIPKNLKAKSHKLGTNYQPETIAMLFKAKPKESLEQKEQQEEAPLVILETPILKPRTPGTKPAKEEKKKQQDEEMDKARDIAKVYALDLMRQRYGWPENPFMMIGPDGREWADLEEWDRQKKEQDTTFKQFTDWQKELARQGENLPAIYDNDKFTGHISVLRSEFEKQFTEFLDQRDHPEKYAAVQELPEDQQEQPAPVPVEQHQEEQQQTEPKKPSPVEQARQEIEAQRSALFQEVQRINTANEKRWREKRARKKIL